MAVLNPYRAIGLQRNPFVGEEQLGLPRPYWVDRGWSQAPSCYGKQLIQVLGDRGYGKTSHLRHWQSQTGGPYCYFPPGWQRWKLPPVADIAFWDEADRIPLPCLMISLVWARLTKATIVTGTHVDQGKIADFVGLSVRTIHLPPLDAETLISWATGLIEAVRLPEMPCSLILTPIKAEEITAIAQGSWRIAADYLHIWAAEVAKASTSTAHNYGSTPM